MWMLVNGIPMRFSMTEFALITGLDCSTGLDEETLRNTSIGNRLCYKYFGGSTNIYVHDLKKKLETLEHREDIGLDKVRIALVLFPTRVLMGLEYSTTIRSDLLGLAENICLFDECNWGVEVYKYTLGKMKKDFRAKVKILKNDKEKKSKLTYTFNGFVHAFQVRIISNIISLLVYIMLYLY